MFIHWWHWLPCKCTNLLIRRETNNLHTFAHHWHSHWEQSGTNYLPQGHFDLQTGGTKPTIFQLMPISSTSWSTVALSHWQLTKSNCVLFFFLIGTFPHRDEKRYGITYLNMLKLWTDIICILEMLTETLSGWGFCWLMLYQQYLHSSIFKKKHI